jgi:YVTN family beta-propeller protein
VNPATHKAYIAVNTYAGTAGVFTGEVLVLDGTTNSITAKIPVGNYADAIVVNPTINRIYVGNANDKSVSIINGANNEVVTTLAIPASPYTMAINTTTNSIYVFDGTSSTMDVINGATSTLAASVDVGVYADAATVDETTQTLFLAGMNNAPGDETPALYAVNGTSFSVSPAIPTGTKGNVDFAVAVNDATGKVYTLPSWTSQTFVMDSASNAVAGPISTGVQPNSLAVDTATNTVYIADYFNGTVLALDGGSNTIISTIQTPSVHMAFVAVDPSSNVIYAANYDAAPSVTVINGSSNSIITTIPLQ